MCMRNGDCSNKIAQMASPRNEALRSFKLQHQQGCLLPLISIELGFNFMTMREC